MMGTRPQLRTRPLHWGTSCQVAWLPCCHIQPPPSCQWQLEKGSRTESGEFTCVAWPAKVFHIFTWSVMKILRSHPCFDRWSHTQRLQVLVEFATALQVCTAHRNHPGMGESGKASRYPAPGTILHFSIGGKVSPSFLVYAKFKSVPALKIYKITFGFMGPHSFVK